MLLTSHFTPDRSRHGSFIAALWQGEAPPGIVVQRWLYLGVPMEGMLLVWEAADDDERAWLERRLGSFGELRTWVSDDATPGMVAAVERDLDGFGAFLRGRATPEESIASQLDLRARGAAAATFEDAVAAGAAWMTEQA